MASSTEYRDRVLGLLLPFGPVRARAMFGGFGLFLDDVMFALIARDVLYFKADEQNRADYIAAGAGPFTYPGRRRPIEMSYYEVPDAVMDDVEALAGWAGRAHEAAQRAKRRGKR